MAVDDAVTAAPLSSAPVKEIVTVYLPTARVWVVVTSRGTL